MRLGLAAGLGILSLAACSGGGSEAGSDGGCPTPLCDGICCVNDAPLCLAGICTTDKSSVLMLANPQQLLADGVTQSMLMVTAIGADGLTPYSGSAMLNSTTPVKFGQSQENSDAITIANGSGVETVTCDGIAHSSCYGTATIYGYLQSNGAGHSSSVTVTFEAP